MMKILFFLFHLFARMPSFVIFILLILSNLQASSLTVLSAEQTILLSLKQHWGNPSALESWTSNSSICNWLRVNCDTSGAATALYLFGSNITGTIPSSTCQLRNLTSIDLSNNNISGHIPDWLQNCSNLKSLDLSSNALAGTIPGELFRMKSLNYLSLKRNRLVGVIPTRIEAHGLHYLNLSDNHLNGSIPSDIGNLYNLLKLDLSMNSFSGTIPRELFNIHQMLSLSLGYNNHLNGSIPGDIGKLYNLKQLDLSMNSFSGAIPRELFNMHRMISLSLGYNNLSGQLPPQLNSPRLQILNLTHNRLNGTITKSLGRTDRLSTLDLSENQLSGDIAEIFLYSRSISVLRLCSNKFMGKIPRKFVKMNVGENCLDFSNLCSDNSTEGLPSCPSTLCSGYRQRFFGYVECKPKRFASKTLIIVLGVGCLVVGLAIFSCTTTKCKKRLFSRSYVESEETIKMISFQKLEFNETEILTSLTDNNLIGNGGSGKVFRALINQTGSFVAVKSISNSTKSDHRLEKEFAAEIQTLGTIRHCNIVKLLCYISGDNMKLLVYQYFQKGSLDQWLHGNSSATKLDWPMRLNIAVGVAQGLRYMHHDCSPPIIHRDIKSSSILLDYEFNAKIADFGLAKLMNGRAETETETASTVAGTFGYIAPEYAYTSKVNTQIDVYSFGVVLLELTTGRKAVTRGDHMNLAEWAQLQYIDTSVIFDAVDDEIKEAIYLEQIVAVFRLGVICTAKSPSNRPSMKDCEHILVNIRNNVSSR